jgi:aminoglycoside N3'-acetyltransferase
MAEIAAAVRALGLKPGDTLIVHTPHPVTAEQALTIRNVIAAQLPISVPIIVAPRDVEFVVCSPVAVDADT